MRKEFSAWIEKFGKAEGRLIFLTGDLGYKALEGVQAALAERFINMGVSEQNMVTVAAGLAQQDLIPLCYSIAPFMVFRPYEQIRVDVALHNFNVKIVGNGGGYGYGIMGATHHAIEDLAALSALQNFKCMIPLANSDVVGACEAVFDYKGPSYLRLGYGVYPESLPPLGKFQPIRQIVHHKSPSPRITICGLGPVLLNLLPWIHEKEVADVFAISQLPLTELTDALLASVEKSGKLWVIEEHVARGGCGEHLAAHLARRGIRYRLIHSHAVGYPNGRYGSQAFHQQQSGMDTESLQGFFKEHSNSTS